MFGIIYSFRRNVKLNLAASIALLIFYFGCISQMIQAQTTEFTYQGQLQNASAPANGNFDFEFLLFDALTGGAQVGSTISQNNVAVTNGLFSVKLNFGANFPGANRFLEIRVRQTGGGAFTTLSPRQAITSAPYAVKSMSAVNADTATTATTAANLSGALNGDVTGTQTNTTVGKLRGIPLDTTAPTDGQMLRYDAANNKWTPVTMPTGGTTPANYVFAYTTPSSVTSSGGGSISFLFNGQINGWDHPLGTETFTCAQTGLYLISYTAHVRQDLATSIAVLLNDVEVSGSRSKATATAGSIIPVAKTVIVNLNSGDIIKLRLTGGIGTNGDSSVPSASITIIRIQ